MEEDIIIYNDLDIYEATRLAMSEVREKKRRYCATPNITLSEVRRFLYSNGRLSTKGLEKAWRSLV